MEGEREGRKWKKQQQKGRDGNRREGMGIEGKGWE